MNERTVQLEYLAFCLAQLRHAYSHLVEERVHDQRQFAKGLIGPVISNLETLYAHLDEEAVKEFHEKRDHSL